MSSRSPEDVIRDLRIALRLAQDHAREFQRDAAKRDKYLQLSKITIERFIDAGRDLYKKANACSCCHCGAIDSIKRVMNPNRQDPESLNGVYDASPRIIR